MQLVTDKKLEASFACFQNFSKACYKMKVESVVLLQGAKLTTCSPVCSQSIQDIVFEGAWLHSTSWIKKSNSAIAGSSFLVFFLINFQKNH